MVISESTATVPSRYRLIEEVGQGGMAIVYRAKDDSLKREVAIKVLHRHLSEEPESKARLEREAQAVAKLRHDNILEIFDYSGADASSSYIVTELIHGETLKAFLGRRSIGHPEIASLITAELCGALVHAHGMGIIHRDVKPENVMIRNDGLLKLMDFGIAQVLDLERMTVTGQLLGSPAYMAPELIEGKPLDVRTDVFSLGILLYQMATGVLPFSGKNPHEVLRRIAEGRFPDPRGLNRLVGAGLGRIMSRALARDPDARYPDMKALLADLTEQLGDAGLGEPRAELRAYFADPDAFEKALPDRMTPALMATAAKQVAARNAGRGIECWNRVLAYAPEHPEVTAALERFEGRGRRRRLALVAAAGVAAMGLAVGIGTVGSRGGSSKREGGQLGPATAPSAGAASSATRGNVGAKGQPGTPGPGGAENANVPVGAAGPGALLPSPSPTTTPTPGTTLAVAEPDRGSSTGGAEHGAPGSPTVTGRGAGSARGAHGRSAERGAAETEGSRAALGGGAAEAALAGASRTFALGPTPQNVDVYLDGERQFAYDMDHRNLTVPWTGTHQIEFRSPSGCCFVERVEIGPERPVPPDNVIARKLKWKPARLTVTTQPPAPGARIMVRDAARPDRGSVVSPGEEANIPFLATDEGQKEIDLSVDTGSGLVAERVLVRAGEHKSVSVSLDRAGRPAAGP